MTEHSGLFTPDHPKVTGLEVDVSGVRRGLLHWTVRTLHPGQS